MPTYSRDVAIAKFEEGKILLASIAKRHNVDMKSILGHYNFAYLVAIRKEFCLRAKAEIGLGCISTGKILHRSYTTVLYHRSPIMQARKSANRPLHYSDERKLKSRETGSLCAVS